MSWIGVDLDGTLAEYDCWKGVNHIGKPIPRMVNRVKRWLVEGKCVKVFTARMHSHGVMADDFSGETVDALTPIQNWCKEHIGQVIEVTNVKDFGMVELWDDRAVQVIQNTGLRVDGNP